MKLPGCDLVFFESGCCGVKCAQVADEGLRRGRRDFNGLAHEQRISAQQ
jgi:hypothetical protein